MAVALKRGFDGIKNKLYLEVALSFAHTTLFNSIFLVGFALALGANNLQVGILLAIPLFANLLQLVSAFILEATGTKKYTTIVNLFFGRFILVMAVVMAFGLIHENPILLFTTVLIMSNFFVAIGNLSLLSWTKDLVPVRKLARFLGKKNIYASIGGMVVYLTGSYMIDKFPGTKIYAYLFLFSILIGLIAILFLMGVPERRRKIKAISPEKFFKRLSLPFKDANFRPLIYFSVPWAFSINLAAPFFLVFMLDDLSLSFFLVSVFLVIDTLARLYGLNLWRNMIDKFGARPTLVVTATVTSLVPLAMIFIGMHNYFFILPIFIISAISYAGVDIAISHVLFKSAKRKYDAYYFSSFSSFVGIASALGPIVGGLMALLIKNYNHIIFLDKLSPLKYIFFASFVLRMSCIPLISRINEKKAGDVGDIIERIKTLKFASFFVNIYSFADYISNIVLVPQKQIFILQRKTIFRMRKDMADVKLLLSKIVLSLGNITRNNIQYYKNRIKGQEQALQREVNKLEYVEGSNLKKIPEKVLDEVKILEKSIETESKTAASQKAKEIKKAVEGYEEKLEKEYKKEIFVKKGNV
ncbi:MAG: MFS transporter [Nanoarchaeota archaeon]|nr:MFS transporter [Nanoarchaeota archaeon]